MRLDLAYIDRTRIEIVVDPDLDGVIEINPLYSELHFYRYSIPVRIATEDGYYIKGCAVYNTRSFPDGIDAVVYSKTGDPFRKFEADDTPFDCSDAQKQAVYEYLKQADDELKSIRDALNYKGLHCEDLKG